MKATVPRWYLHPELAHETGNVNSEALLEFAVCSAAKANARSPHWVLSQDTECVEFLFRFPCYTQNKNRE